ncbi:Tetratricopeptide repeat-like superfamily protein [Theobroma cacao]|uniref:Tetratricopeptide repeat-like superfamily protein n=1 Tax=Theobroma cacao TaxID=3641 RepID=A0A061E7M0_THECC|nr:Tetratricopeptide repeat-like superfamily protein [Theobroma cacao]
MAVVLGNLALLLDVTSARTVTPDRKSRPLAIDVLLNLPKRDPYFFHASVSNKSQLDSSDGENRAHRVVARGKANSKVKAVDFDAGSSDDDGNGNGNGFEEEEEEYDWEKEMRKRVKEIEEMRELEKKAEELQSKAEAEESEGEGSKETEEKKRMRVRKELEKVAQEQAERRATAQLMFELGQKAYGKGMYGRAIEFLEGALTIIPRPTLFGGEIQIWLAMAYEANNRHADCIALYQQLEKRHPSVSIRRQAAELRYILQAPKLKISQEEMVTIPLIGSSYDSYAATWSDKYKDKDQRSGSTTNQLPSSRDFLGDFLVWRPPVGLEKNQAFWVALTLWFGLVGAALFLQR